MTIYIPKPGTWFIPFVPARCIEQYTDPKKAFFGCGLFAGWIWKGKPCQDEEICLMNEFWKITL